MPALISTNEFIEETRDDFNSPTTSSFGEKILSCRRTVAALEENLEYDREGLYKMKKAIKAMYNGGIEYGENGHLLSKSLERLGANAVVKDSEAEIGSAFIKFSIVTKELSNLMKTLMQNINNIMMFPLDSILKGDLKGVKGDLRKPFEKAFRDYEAKMSKIEKEKKQQAKEAGLFRAEISSAEIAEELDKERKMFQLQMCDYLLKMNEIKSKKGVELLQHLIEFYHAQCTFFQDGLKTIEHFDGYINELSYKLTELRSGQEDERKQLSELRNLLRSSSPTFECSSVTGSPNQFTGNGTNAFFGSSGNQDIINQINSRKDKSAYNLHQLQGNKDFGFVKSGYLYKKPDKKMRMKVWHKRRCEVKDGCLHVYHSDESKSPVKINLLTCQVKPSSDDKKAFDLMSYLRTYHFQAEDEFEAEAWISVLLNCNQAALQQEFHNNGEQASPDWISQYHGELCRNIIANVFRLPGNDCCVDCASQNDVTWFSTNFGVLLCIQCSGIHRDMGVHVSRVHSLTLDHMSTSQLLLPAHMSNAAFNRIFEANCVLNNEKIRPEATMEQRCAFIRAKYVQRKFVMNTTKGDEHLLRMNLEQAVSTRNLYQLLQCFGEHADLNWVLPSYRERGDTALHLAITQEDNSSLHMIEFLVQNSKHLNVQNRDGNTPLHLAVMADQKEAIKLLLKAQADPSIMNSDHKSSFDLAIDYNRINLIPLLEQSKQDDKSAFEYVNVQWNLSADDASTDFSDEDQLEDKNTMKDYYDWILNEGNQPPINVHKKQHSRKSSLSSLMANVSNNAHNHHGRVSNSKSLDKRIIFNRPSSVIEPAEASFGSLRTTAIGSIDLQGNRPPPVPPHQSKLTPLGYSAHHQSQMHLRDTKKAGHRKGFVHHVRTISDSGLKRSGMPIKSNTIDSHSSSFNHKNNNYPDERGRLIDELRARHQSNQVPVAQVTPSHLLGDNALANHCNIPTSPLPPPPQYAQRCGQTVVGGAHEQSPLIEYPSMSRSGDMSTSALNKMSAKMYSEHGPPASPASVLHRKQHVYGEGMQIRSAQSIESLPSLSSDELSAKYSPIPVPPPRKKQESIDQSGDYKRCRALYDCEADRDDELAFKQGEIIVILNEKTEDENWMEGMIEGDYSRRGVFPISFVQMIN